MDNTEILKWNQRSKSQKHHSNPKDFNPKRKSLFIFDDIMTEKNQDPASNFYTRGRHNNCSCIYILKIIISYLVKQ